MSKLWNKIVGIPVAVDKYSSPFITAEGVTTLGSRGTDFLTCSEDMVQRRFPEQKLHRVSSFEDGAQRVIEGESKFLLVPAAYPSIRTFFMSEDLIARESFLATIPALGLVKNNSSSNDIDKIHYHPATTSLLSMLTESINIAIESTSNAEAYSSMLEGGDSDACMTNSLVAHHYGQKLHRVLRAAKPMGWFVFERA